jgi:hypothetical protein
MAGTKLKILKKYGLYSADIIRDAEERVGRKLFYNTKIFLNMFG